MLNFIHRFAAVFAVVVCASCFSSAARADLSIAVVDIQRLQSQSSAAKSIQSQLEQRREALQSEFAGYEQGLRENERQLIENKDELSAEEFAARRKEFEGKLLQTGELVQKRRRDLEVLVANATKSLNDEIFKIVAAEAEKNNYQLVLTRQNVVLVEKSIDITEFVMNALNERLKKIDLGAE